MKDRCYAQIYSIIRQERNQTMKALEALSEIGYDGVEILGTYTGSFTREEYKNYFKELNLIPISSHALETEEDMEFGQFLGLKFCDMRFPTHERTRDAVLEGCEYLNKQGRLAAKYGIKGVLHNHAEEFLTLTGEDERIYDVILKNTDPEYVGMEFDVGWGARAGVDVINDYIKKYPGRFDLIHVKSCQKAAENEQEMEHFPSWIIAMQPPTISPEGAPVFSEEQKRLMYETRSWNGELGVNDLIDWKALVEAADAQGCAGYINEREYYHVYGIDGDPLACAAKDLEFLRSL